jgi:hypothetical protein
MAKIDHEKLNRRSTSGLHDGYLGRYDPVLDGKMPWGKYKHRRFAGLPLDYLAWAVQNIDAGSLRDKLDGEYLRRMEEDK